MALSSSSKDAGGLRFPRDRAAWRRWQQSQNPLRTVRHRLSRREPEPLEFALSADGDQPSLAFVFDSGSPSEQAALASVVSALPRGTAVLIGTSAALSRVVERMDAALDGGASGTGASGTGASGTGAPGTGVHTRAPGGFAPEGGPWPSGLRIVDSFDAPDVLDTIPLLASVRAVVTLGNYLPIGAEVCSWAARTGRMIHVVQHGLLTPFAPPLPTRSHLHAFDAADAAFWTAGRDDVSASAVGSQLLWQSAHGAGPGRGSDTESGGRSGIGPDSGTGGERAGDGGAGPRLTFLGQLHGAELPRPVFARAASSFCRATGAIYRPHPAESDILSRAQHRMWRARGIEIAAPDTPLAAGRTPVAAVFSTGVLEAAAQGTPAWVHCPSPPRWVEEMWDRYSMRRFGGPATPAPALPDTAPARAIAEALSDGGLA